jgi:hypothetical protein
MKRLLLLLLPAFCLLPGTVRPASDPCSPDPCLAPPPPVTYFCAAPEEDHPWIFRPSYYSHDPYDGKRVAQYEPLPRVYGPNDPSYMRSGYRHEQLMFRGADGTADRLHVVETWGLGDRIRPYGEWLYPYRAGATPYGPWGNPQGPWTLPFESWVNPYGLGQLPNPPWGPYYPPYYPQYQPYPNPYRGNNPMGPYGGGTMPYSGGPQGGFPPQNAGPHGGGPMPTPSPPPAP